MRAVLYPIYRKLEELARRLGSVAAGPLRSARRRLQASLVEGSGAGDGAPKDLSDGTGGITHRRIETLMSRSLLPEERALFVKLAYGVLLGRPVDDPTLERVCDQLATGETSRHRFLQDIVEMAEFREAALLEEVIMEALCEGTPSGSWDALRCPNTSERLVEVPWVLSRYRGEPRVLDIGYAYAEPPYLTGLLGLDIPELHGIDAAPRGVPGVLGVGGDARALPYRDDAFDLVICVSTLEHIGRDNTRYDAKDAGAHGADLQSLRELARVMTLDARLLVTVPIGRFEDHGWFVQYDPETWSSLVERSPLVVDEQEVFESTDSGWASVPDLDAVRGLRYGDGVSGARAVLCTALRHSS